jgi:hypothetical protein
MEVVEIPISISTSHVNVRVRLASRVIRDANLLPGGDLSLSYGWLHVSINGVVPIAPLNFHEIWLWCRALSSAGRV